MNPSPESSPRRRGPLDDREIQSLWRSLRDFVRRRVRASDQAEDIVQESLLRALSSSPDELKSTQAWLRVVAQRLILDEARSRRRRVARERVAARPEHVPPVDAELASRVEIAMRYVAELREPYREVVLLRYRDGLDTAEIADRLGRSGDTVRTQLKRGLDLLRERLGAERATPKRRRLLLILPWRRSATPRETSSVVARWAMWAAAVGVATLCGTWLVRESRVSSTHESLVAKSDADDPDARTQAHALVSVEADVGSGRMRIAPSATPAADAPASLSPRLGHPLRGRIVYRTTGTAIVDATILAASEGMEQVTRLGSSNKRGEFDVTLPELPAWVWAEHERYSATARKLVDRGFVESDEPLVLESIREGQIKGMVVDDRGEPVPQARVVMDIPIQLHATRDPHGMLVSQPPSIVATTDDAGCFTAPTLPGRVRLTVTADGYGKHTTVGVLVNEPIHVALSRDDVSVLASSSDGELEDASRSTASMIWTEPAPRHGIRSSASPEPSPVVAGEASIHGCLLTTTAVRGPELALRLDGDGPASLRRTQRDELGRFEFAGLSSGRYLLSVEGGGVHGAWIVTSIVLDVGERRDLGVLRTPAPGSVFVHARPTQLGAEGPAAFTLVGERSSLRGHFRTQGLGIEIDRVACTIAIRAVWPGEYRLIVEGGKLSTVATACEVLEACETRLELAIESAKHTFVSLKPARPLRQGERWSVFLITPAGSTELESMDTRFQQLPDGTLTFNTGVTLDVERIEVRTSLGLAGGINLTQLPLESRWDLQIELH